MKLILRLYRQHDLDLIALHRDDDFCLSAAVRQTMDAYVNHKTLSIQAPGPKDLPAKKIPRQIQIIIKLDEKKDAKSIEWLKGMKEGYRNSCVKNLLRGYLTYPVVYVYREVKDYEAIKENNEVFIGNTKATQIIPKRVRHYIPKKKNVADEILNEKKEENTIYIENVEKEVDVKKLADEILKPKDNISDEENDEMLDVFDSMMESL